MASDGVNGALATAVVKASDGNSGRNSAASKGLPGVNDESVAHEGPTPNKS